MSNQVLDFRSINGTQTNDSYGDHGDSGGGEDDYHHNRHTISHLHVRLMVLS